MRGVGVANSRDFNNDPLALTIELAPVQAKLKYVHIAGTAPSQMVDADSKLARTFFGHFEMSARGNGGSTIKIPEDIRSFTGHDGKVEPLLLGDPTVLDWGKVEMIYCDGSKYKGFMLNEWRHGYGEMEYLDGSHYTGAWKDNKREY